MATFPTVIDDVTAPWLTETLRSSGALGSGSQVSHFDIDPIGMGIGIMGLLYRLSLHYDGDGAGPAVVVAKLASSDPQARHVSRVFRFYEKEVGFYRNFAALTPIPTPACYAADHNPETDDFVLLLEDFGDAGVHSQVDGCPPEEALPAVRSIARHHAMFADSPLFDDPDFAWLPFGSDSPNPEGVIQGLADAWEPFQQTFPELVTSELAAIMERFGRSARSLLTVKEGRPITLVHGDYRLDNLFFSGGGADSDGGPDSEASAVTAIDWQVCAKGPCAYDLGYFMTQSLTVEDRRTHEAALIDAYLAELEAAGVVHDPDMLIDDYRATAMFCLCYPIQAGNIELVNDRARALIVDNFNRAMTAIDDHNATEFLLD